MGVYIYIKNTYTHTVLHGDGGLLRWTEVLSQENLNYHLKARKGKASGAQRRPLIYRRQAGVNIGLCSAAFSSHLSWETLKGRQWIGCANPNRACVILARGPLVVFSLKRYSE